MKVNEKDKQNAKLQSVDKMYIFCPQPKESITRLQITFPQAQQFLIIPLNIF